MPTNHRPGPLQRVTRITLWHNPLIYGVSIHLQCGHEVWRWGFTQEPCPRCKDLKHGSAEEGTTRQG